MGVEKPIITVLEQCAKYAKTCGLHTKPVHVPCPEGLKYVPKLTEDVVQLSSHTNPIEAVYNFRQRFGQFMADYRCAFMAKYEFRAFKNTSALNPDYLLRDMQCYKHVGQSQSRMEEILNELLKYPDNKEALIKEFEELCEQTLSRKSEFQGLKGQLKQLHSKYLISLDKRGLKPAREVENAAELVRKPHHNGERLPRVYVENSRDVRNHFNSAIDNGTYLDSYESYVETMNNAHKLAYSGKSGKNLYYVKDGKPYVMEAGKWRTEGITHRRDTSRLYYGDESVEKIAQRYNDPLQEVMNMGDVSKSTRVKLKNIPEKYQPKDTWECDDFDGFLCGNYTGHTYAPPEAFELYHKEMYRTAQEAIRRIKNCESEERILEVLAEHFQYAANARPYRQINNSLYMNEINTLLQRAGMKTMPHSNLDIVAQRLQPETFKKYFIDTYHKTALPYLNVDKCTFATFNC